MKSGEEIRKSARAALREIRDNPEIRPTEIARAVGYLLQSGLDVPAAILAQSWPEMFPGEPLPSRIAGYMGWGPLQEDAATPISRDPEPELFMLE